MINIQEKEARDSILQLRDPTEDPPDKDELQDSSSDDDLSVDSEGKNKEVAFPFQAAAGPLPAPGELVPSTVNHPEYVSQAG